MSLISPRKAGDLILYLLRQVHSDHVGLGPDGRALRTELNQFNGLSFVAGFRAEEIVISRLHLYAASTGVTFRVISMDHPDQMIPERTKVPDFTVYVIGLDGAAALAGATDGQLRFRTSRVPFDLRPQYGTRIAIASGPCPEFSEIIATGVLRPTTNQILVAVRRLGVRLFGAYQIGSDAFVYTNQEWKPDGLVYCDSTVPCLSARFAGPLASAYKMTTITPNTPFQSLFDLTVGTALASCDWTRNGGLELITSYLPVTAGGGIVANMEGLDIGSELAHHWGTTGTAFYVAAGGYDPLEYILTAVPDQLPT